MTRIYRERFAELNEQMEALLASKVQKPDPILGRMVVDIEGDTLLEWRVKAKNLLSKACGKESEHYLEFVNNEQPRSFGNYLSMLESLRAIFLAAREDYEGGYLQDTRSLVQAEVFDTELEQATELLISSYKVPAAVIAGVVLETSLRELCEREGIQHGKLDKMNSDLAKAGVYNKLQQKRITALADIRNSAAHGKPEDFSERDVEDMIRDIERFVAEHL